METRQELLFKNKFLLGCLFLDPRFKILFTKAENADMKKKTIAFLSELYNKITTFEKKGLLNYCSEFQTNFLGLSYRCNDSD